jgi:hypothetical protein
VTVVEAQGGHGWRYFKAYVADRLDGEWRLRAQTAAKDIRARVEKFIYVHPSSMSQLVRLMPEWMTEKSKRVPLPTWDTS